MADDDRLRFKVAPHIVEDLGLNLYTSLPRVLVEFVANAYDADSPQADVTLDRKAIEKAREIVKKEFEVERAKKDAEGLAPAPLATRTLPSAIAITIQDGGHGMTRGDLAEKFLVAGRRRRVREPEANGRSPRGRLLMGRKGLGKLAGFGVAKVVTVTTKTKEMDCALSVVLDYDKLSASADTTEIVVPDTWLKDDGGLGGHGTRIVLSSLLYDPLKSRQQTIEHEIAEHFMFIKDAEFRIRMNAAPIVQPARTFSFAWPQPDLDPEDFVGHSYQREDGGAPIHFQYRMRFTGKDEALPAAQRGVRVYAHDRLSAAPSLLDADTNMHGFRMTDYLDGVVKADFVDDEDTDYIATDRQSLRWDSPLLVPMHEFLSAQIKEACKEAQKYRDEIAPKEVENDKFTQEQLAKSPFSTRERRMALRIAIILGRNCKRGVADPIYRNTLPVLLKGIGHGSILSAISELAAQEHPDLHRVAAEIARLTRDELDHFISRAKTRLAAIESLKKIVTAADFKDAQNEGTLQKLFESSPWIIDPGFSQVLTADTSLDSLTERLAKQLHIGQFAKVGDGSDRPDLVFLLANGSLGKLVIVELKSANTPLENDHLVQLKDYMSRARNWLKEHASQKFVVHGQLLGSMPDDTARGKGTRVLRSEMEEAGPNTMWVVRDYLRVLTDTEAAHRELIEARERADRVADSE